MAEPRVLHISTPRSWRGGEQQLAYLLEEMQQQGWPTTVLCSPHAPLHQWCATRRIETLPFARRGINNMLLGRRLLQLCRQRPFDLIHAHDPHAHAAAVFAADMGLKIPLVVSRRVDFPVRNAWFSRRKYNHPAIVAIVCVSDAIRHIMQPAIRRPGILRVVHSGIDPSRIDLSLKGAKKLHHEFSVPEDHILVGNVAALAPHKDYPTFLRTAALLLEQNPKMFFLAIGEGPSRPEVEKLILEMGLELKVRLTGFRDDIPRILPQLDVMLFTSQTEGLGTSVLDAFAAGVPVVSTAAGGIPEMVEHGKTGMLAPVKDAQTLAQNVQAVLNDPQLRRTIVDGARQKLQQFTRTAMAEKTMNLYRELLKEDTESHRV